MCKMKPCIYDDKGFVCFVDKEQSRLIFYVCYHGKIQFNLFNTPMIIWRVSAPGPVLTGRSSTMKTEHNSILSRDTWLIYRWPNKPFQRRRLFMLYFVGLCFPLFSSASKWAAMKLVPCGSRLESTTINYQFQLIKRHEIIIATPFG